MKPVLWMSVLAMVIVGGCRLPVSDALKHEGGSVTDFNMTVDYEVWLPEGYEKDTTREYPVLVWFHGGGENELGWGREGRIGTIVRDRVAKGAIQPFIVVSPSAGTFQPIFRTYDKLLVEYILPDVEKRYRTNGTTVGFGHSMGGLSALIVALKHPGLFKGVVVSSPFVYDTCPWDSAEQKAAFDSEYGGRFVRRWRYQVGMNFDSREEYDEWSPYSLLRSGVNPGCPLLLTVGDQDPLGLYANNMNLHEVMAAQNIEHEWYVQEGVGHGTVEDARLMDWLNEQAQK